MKRSFKSSQEAFKSHAKNQYNENVTKNAKKVVHSFKEICLNMFQRALYQWYVKSIFYKKILEKSVSSKKLAKTAHNF